MRLIFGVPMIAVTLAGLAACGQSDEAFRASYRTRSVAACTTGARSAPNSAGVDAERLCGCMVDRYMRETTTERLKAETSQTEPPPAARTAMIQCASEMAASRAGVPTAPGTNTTGE